MKIKSYFAKTINEAMDRARVELGSEAMIIASNRTSGDAQRLGVYEVVFGIDDDRKVPEVSIRKPVFPAVSATKLVTPPLPSPTPPKASLEPAEGLERLKARMEDLRKSVSKKREKVSQAKLPLSARVASVLTQSGFPRQIAEEFAAGMPSSSRDDRADIVGAVRSQLSASLRVAPRLGSSAGSRSTVAIVGPPGVGKTSSIVKLAIKYGIAAGRPTRLISTDTHRFAGTELLRRYAEAMDIRFDAPTTTDALDRALTSEGRNALVLIDTEGFGSVCERGAGLATFLAGRSDIEVHLALPSFASHEDLSTIASRFKPFLPSKLILTGFDMCSNVGPMLSYVLGTESAVSFLGTGREIPEDIEEASANALTTRLLPSLVAAAANAA